MDYSKLTDEQLEAISRNDYSRLPEAVLNQIVNENQVAPGATTRAPDPANFNRDAARQAGYTDEEIDAYLRNPQRSETRAETAGQEAAGLGRVVGATILPAVQYAIENPLTTAATGYGAYKGAQAVNAGVNILKNLAEKTTPPGGGSAPVGSPSNPIGGTGAGPSASPSAGRAPTRIPVTAPSAVAPSPILDAAGRPITPPTGSAPIAPQAAPLPQAAPATPQPSILDRTTAMIRQLAANKVVQGMAKGGAGLAAALMPGNVGQDYMVPQVGRMRGMEINPMTGRPWTREQLAAYNANPQQFDIALGAAQMPR